LFEYWTENLQFEPLHNKYLNAQKAHWTLHDAIGRTICWDHWWCDILLFIIYTARLVWKKQGKRPFARRNVRITTPERYMNLKFAYERKMEKKIHKNAVWLKRRNTRFFSFIEVYVFFFFVQKKPIHTLIQVSIYI